MGPNSSSYSSLDLAMNQSSHSRPILPTYNQALGVGLGSQSVLRLPEYKQSYLARYTPYCRYTSHPRFFCDDVRIFLLHFVYLIYFSERSRLQRSIGKTPFAIHPLPYHSADYKPSQQTCSKLSKCSCSTSAVY